MEHDYIVGLQICQPFPESVPSSQEIPSSLFPSYTPSEVIIGSLCSPWVPASPMLVGLMPIDGDVRKFLDFWASTPAKQAALQNRHSARHLILRSTTNRRDCIILGGERINMRTYVQG